MTIDKMVQEGKKIASPGGNRTGPGAFPGELAPRLVKLWTRRHRCGQPRRTKILPPSNHCVVIQRLTAQGVLRSIGGSRIGEGKVVGFNRRPPYVHLLSQIEYELADITWAHTLGRH